MNIIRPNVWPNMPCHTYHDCDVYILAGRLPIHQDARREIQHALVDHICDRLRRLRCPRGRHLRRVIQIRHMISVPNGRLPIITPKPKDLMDILASWFTNNPNVLKVLREACKYDPGDSVLWKMELQIILHFRWMGYAFEDIYGVRTHPFWIRGQNIWPFDKWLVECIECE